MANRYQRRGRRRYGRGEEESGGYGRGGRQTYGGEQQFGYYGGRPTYGSYGAQTDYGREEFEEEPYYRYGEPSYGQVEHRGGQDRKHLVCVGHWPSDK